MNVMRKNRVNAEFSFTRSRTRRLISAWNVAISPHFAIPYLELCQVGTAAATWSPFSSQEKKIKFLTSYLKLMLKQKEKI